MGGAREDDPVRVGRYEIVRELGRGGMARVHLARQLDLDRYAALKELGSLHREHAEMAARFVRESRLAGALNHPSIVTVLDFFEHDGTPYIAMEYVPRGSLRPWVGRLTVAQVGGVLESVLAGLAHAHAGAVVHRDLKPENLMVTDDGHVKITDFGIAKALIDSGTVAFRTATGAAIGTPAYMSPEQAMGEGVGPWTDLYATGVIAYELLCGSVPFGNREAMAILLAHCQETPVP
jgi:serine/threonine protein kinase